MVTTTKARLAQSAQGRKRRIGTMTGRRYYARSASDRTDTWPFWFVADSSKGSANVTADIIRQHICPTHNGGVFVPRGQALALADVANASEGYTR